MSAIEEGSPRNARRIVPTRLAAVALLFCAACGGNVTGPGAPPLDPAETSTDPGTPGAQDTTAFDGTADTGPEPMDTAAILDEGPGATDAADAGETASACAVNCAERFQSPCLVGACDPTTGDCVLTPRPDGSLCELADPCFAAAACVEGVCKGTAAAPSSCGELTCGLDACGNVCGTCAEPLQCVDGACLDVGCADVPPAGCCASEHAIVSCASGELTVTSCPPDEPFCAWNPAAGSYGCRAEQTEAPKDPPWTCPWVVCDTPCNGLACGIACGVSCGTCPDGALCVEGQCASCEPGCAAPGVTQCLAGALRVCELAGGCPVWSAPTPCAGNVCLDGATCAACPPAECIPGHTECENGALATCEADADGCVSWSTPAPCPSGSCIGAETCDGCDGCAAGVEQCSAGVLSTCTDVSEACTVWQPSACPTGQCADNASCAAACENECPAPGLTACDVGALRTCALTGGCLAWSDPSPCESGLCATGATCAVCPDPCPGYGDTECEVGLLRVCVAGPFEGCTTWAPETPCPSGFCAGDQCGTCGGACGVGGGFECGADTVQVCQVTATGCSEPVDLLECPAGCQDGTCSSCSKVHLPARSWLPGYSLVAAADTLIVAASDIGVDVLVPTPSGSPALVGTVLLDEPANALAIRGSLAAIGHGSSTSLYDLAVPDNPTLTSQIPGEMDRIAMGPERLFLLDIASGLRVYSIADAGAPLLIGSLDTGGQAHDVAADDEAIVVADGLNGLARLTADGPALDSVFGVGTDTRAVALSAGRVFLVRAAGAASELVELDRPDLTVRAITGLPAPVAGSRLLLSGERLYLWQPDETDSGALHLFEPGDDKHVLTQTVRLPHSAASVMSAGSGHLYVAGAGLSELSEARLLTFTRVGGTAPPGTIAAVGLAPLYYAATGGGLQTGLLLADPPKGVTIADAIPPDAGQPNALALVGGHLWAADTTTLRGYDVGAPLEPTMVAEVALPGTGLVRAGTRLLRADGVRLRVADVTSPGAPLVQIGPDGSQPIKSVGADGDIAVAVRPSGVDVYTLAPLSLASSVAGGADAVAVSGGWAWLLDDDALRVLHVGTPDAAKVVATHADLGGTDGLWGVRAHYLAMGSDDGLGLWWLDVSNAYAPRRVLGLRLPAPLHAVGRSGPWELLIDDQRRIHLVDRCGTAP